MSSSSRSVRRLGVPVGIDQRGMSRRQAATAGAFDTEIGIAPRFHDRHALVHSNVMFLAIWRK